MRAIVDYSTAYLHLLVQENICGRNILDIVYGYLYVLKGMQMTRDMCSRPSIWHWFRFPVMIDRNFATGE